MIVLFENEFDFEKDLDRNRWIWKNKIRQLIDIYVITS